MRGAWSTLALVVVAAGLGAYIYFGEPSNSSSETKEKLFTVVADDIEELRISAKDDTTVLKKTDGTWKVVEPVAVDADQSEVTSLLSSLTSLEINREVDPKAADLAQYGLATPKADLRFTAKGGVTGRVRLGDQTPTASDLYAVKGDDPRVFLVSTFVETSLARSTFELRDKAVLKFERDKADGLEITTEGATASFARAASEWKVTAPTTARGDYGAIEGLLTRLSSTRMASIETSDGKDLTTFGLDTPASTVVVKTGSSAATLAVSAEKDGKVYARDLSRPIVFTIDATLAADLKKGVGDYRRKALFEFRAFSAKKIVLTRGAEAITLAKTAGTDGAADKWMIAVGGAAAKDADTTKVDDLLSKLTGLNGESFVAAAPAAMTPTLKVTAELDEAKTDDASIGRAGESAFGTRADEAGAMTLSATAVDEAMKAIDALLAPPPPPAPPTPPATPPTGASAEKKP